MGMAVVTVSSGGMPVIDVTATKPGQGMPVTESAAALLAGGAKLGVAVTKVTVGGIAVTYVAPPL
jgi:hypothetical protein